jgi:hypothetical protein
VCISPHGSLKTKEAIVKRAYKRWDRDEVLKSIAAIHAKGEKLNSGHTARAHPGLAYAGRQYFGSWESAIRAAGLDYDDIRRKNFRTCESIAREIKDLKKAGKPLHYSAAETSYGGLVGAANAHFGSWRKAIEAAGIDYTKVKRQKEWSRSEIAREIKRMKKEGVNLSTTIPVRAKYRILHAAAIRYFGSWAAAMKAAGLRKLYTGTH